MEKQNIIEAISKARQNSKKRNFVQSFDLIVTVKDLDLKKTENQKDLYLPLHFTPTKKLKICAFSGAESLEEAKACDKVITQEQFITYETDPKKTKKLANEFDFFVAQANIMPAVAKSFGKILGRRGKMPNPKAGCVFPPKINLKPLYDRLQNTVSLKLKASPMVQCRIGMEDMKDEEIAENILVIYNAFVHALPNEENNIKAAIVKTTMGKAIKIV